MHKLFNANVLLTVNTYLTDNANHVVKTQFTQQLNNNVSAKQVSSKLEELAQYVIVELDTMVQIVSANLATSELEINVINVMHHVQYVLALLPINVKLALMFLWPYKMDTVLN